MAGPPGRVRIAKSSGLLSRRTVFRTTEGLEEQEIEGYDVSLRRVRFDEILLVTRHQTVNWVAAIAAFFGMGMFGMWSFLAGVIAEKWAVGLLVAAFTAGPLLLLLILLLAVKVEVITVFGQRMRIRMRFWLRKESASRVHDEVCRLAREHQARSGRAVTKTPLAANPPGPLPLEPTSL